MKEGTFKTWFPKTGHIESIKHFHHGEAIGISTRWLYDERSKVTEEFVDGKQKASWYFYNGQLAFTEYWKNNRSANDSIVYWNSDGTRIKTVSPHHTQFYG